MIRYFYFHLISDHEIYPPHNIIAENGLTSSKSIKRTIGNTKQNVISVWHTMDETKICIIITTDSNCIYVNR